MAFKYQLSQRWTTRYDRLSDGACPVAGADTNNHLMREPVDIEVDPWKDLGYEDASAMERLVSQVSSPGAGPSWWRPATPQLDSAAGTDSVRATTPVQG